jgi:hypothetical protein
LPGAGQKRDRQGRRVEQTLALDSGDLWVRCQEPISIIGSAPEIDTKTPEQGLAECRRRLTILKAADRRLAYACSNLAGCSARVAIGHAAAAPPTSVMNSAFACDPT